jgi:hypothetical protein
MKARILFRRAIPALLLLGAGAVQGAESELGFTVVTERGPKVDGRFSRESLPYLYQGRGPAPAS